MVLFLILNASVIAKVDDIDILVTIIKGMKELRHYLHQIFHSKELGNLKYFLGIQHGKRFLYLNGNLFFILLMRQECWKLNSHILL